LGSADIVHAYGFIVDHARILMSVNNSKTAFSVLVNVLTSQEVTAASVLKVIGLEVMVEHVKVRES
jgi:hypothetical protein